MPRTFPQRTTLPTRALWLTLATAAALLWLLPLFSSHPVLFPAGANFVDITVYKGRFTLYHSAKFFTSRAFSAFAYPPGSAPLYEAFYRTRDPIHTYLVLAAVATLFALAAALIYLRRNRAVSAFPLLLLFSFPLVFLIQRANIELILWVLVVLGLIACRKGAAILAAILFGLAAALKLYPILLLGLFVKPAARRSRQDIPAFFLGLATAIFALGASIAYTGPTFALAAHGFFTGVDRFQDHYVDTVTHIEVLFDHSLFSPFKYWAFVHHRSPAAWRPLYYLAAGTVALLLFLRVRTLPLLNRMVFLIAAMVSLPPVSFTYTLVHLYLPLILLTAYLAAARTPPTALLAVTLLLFLMLPLAGASVLFPLPTGPIQSCALLALLLVSTLNPWREPSLPVNA